jgi:hypothetical protein
MADQPFRQVKVVRSHNMRQAFTIPERRDHIANIHNQIKKMIDSDWVFSVEDDGILPPNALMDLALFVEESVGLITGVELGRWGVPYVGAWRVDDITKPKLVTSLDNRTDYPDLVEAIDGCGLYCALIRADLYQTHEFDSKNGLGPDVNLGLYARQRGFCNYIHWGVHVTHLTSRMGTEIEIPATDTSSIVTLSLVGNTWQQRKSF